MAKEKKQKAPPTLKEIQQILLEWKEIHNFINKGVANGIDAIVKKNAHLCKNEQKQCSITIVKQAYDYKRICNEEITEKITQIIRYYAQKSNYTKTLEEYTNSKISRWKLALQNTIQMTKTHRQADREYTTADMKSKLNQIVKSFFIATSIFEHNVNVFIGQFPIQVFVLTDQTGEEICFFSYDGSNYEVLKTITSDVDMSLKSGTAISFNMTMNKAQQIILDLIYKRRKKVIDGTVNTLWAEDNKQWGTTLSDTSNPEEIINDNLANFVRIRTHQGNLSNIIASNQGVVTEAKKLQEFYRTLNDTLVVPSKNPKIRATRRRVVGLKGATEHTKKVRPYSTRKTQKQKITSWKKQQLRLKIKLQELDTAWASYENSGIKDSTIKTKEDFYSKQISKKHFNQYFNLNGGQLKEGFFGQYFQLEYNEWTTVNSDSSTFLIRRTDLPSYIAAMDNVRARLWGDYNARINGKQYAISVKSDNAGMDINQFIQLANLIINFWTYHGKGKIKTQKDLDQFKDGLIKKIKQMQTKDIVDSQAQKKIEQLGIGYSYSQKGRGHSLETMLETFKSQIVEELNQQLAQ